MSDTFERLRARLHKDFGMPIAALVPEATLESLDVDSLRMIEVAFCAEEEFDVSMQEDHNAMRERLKTLGDLADYVDSLRVPAATA